MDLEQQIDRAITKARVVWVLGCIVFTGWALTANWGWWLLTLPLIWWGSHLMVLFITGAWLAATLPEEITTTAKQDALRHFEELKKRLDAGDIEPGPELDDLILLSGLDIAVIQTTSEETVGRFGDHTIYEWVEMVDPNTKKLERFFFEQVAERDADGQIVLPQIEGKVCAHLNGLIYTRST